MFAVTIIFSFMSLFSTKNVTNSPNIYLFNVNNKNT